MGTDDILGRIINSMDEGLYNGSKKKTKRMMLELARHQMCLLLFRSSVWPKGEATHSFYTPTKMILLLYLF